MSFQIILVIHVLLALGMVGLILIQHGKGAGAGAGFGSGAAGTVFGARGANTFLYKLTAAMALGFFITSISTKRNIHSSDSINFIKIYFGEYNMFFNSKCIISKIVKTF